MSGEREPPPDPGEARLERYLRELRADPPRGGKELAQRVTHAARWQDAMRGPLQALAALAGGLLDGFAILLGNRHRGSGR